MRFELSGIVLDGATAYEEADLRPLWRDLLGKQVSLADIYEIAAKLTARYRNDGYILSRAIVPPQEIRAGVVHIQVIEGYVDDVTIQGELKGPADQVLAKAEKIKQSRPLRADVLERYLLLMNQLPGLNVEAVLRPSETTPGAADLVLSTRHDTVSGDVQLDNRGTDFNGQVELLGHVALSSLLGLYEQTDLQAVITPIEPKELQLIAVEHTELLGTEGTAFSLFGSFVHTEPGDRLEDFDVEGHSVSATASVTHPVLLTRSQRFTIRGEFSFLNSETEFLNRVDFFEDGEFVRSEFFDNSIEDRIRALRLGAAYDFADQYAGVNLIAVEFSQGLDILNATDKGSPNTSREAGRADFTKIALNASRLQILWPGWSLFGAAKGQFAFSQVLAPEEFDFGGETFGRAYDPFELTGDHGVAGRVELRYGQLVGARFLESYQAFVSYDFGVVYRINTNEPTRPEPLRGERRERSEDASSISVGVRFNVTPTISGSIEVAQPLTRAPQLVDPDNDDKSPRPFFRLTATF